MLYITHIKWSISFKYPRIWKTQIIIVNQTTIHTKKQTKTTDKAYSNKEENIFITLSFLGNHNLIYFVAVVVLFDNEICVSLEMPTLLHPSKKLGSEMGSLRYDLSRLALRPLGGSLVIFTPGEERNIDSYQYCGKHSKEDEYFLLFIIINSSKKVWKLRKKNPLTDSY